MTDDEFRAKFLELWKEYDPDKIKDFLFTMVTFDEANDPDDIYIIGQGCPVCIVRELNEQVEDGTLTHTSPKDHKIH
jgi:hypothetical protein